MFGFGKKEEPPGKKFKLQAGQIKNLARGRGACIASDRIMVDGLKVGFMNREEDDEPNSSGWVFLSGEESQEYLDDSTHFGIYDCNTVANYDPEIIPLLDKPVGSAFSRRNGGPLVPDVAPPTE